MYMSVRRASANVEPKWTDARAQPISVNLAAHVDAYPLDQVIIGS
jgi:hypothetical protein